MINLIIEFIIWKEQALLHACSKHERNKLCYMHVADMNQKTQSDLLTEFIIQSEFATMTSEFNSAMNLLLFVSSTIDIYSRHWWQQQRWYVLQTE